MLWLAIARPPVRADFVMAMEEPPTLDPQRVSWNNEIQLTNLMFEGLTRLNARTLQPEPAVASAWEFDAAGNTYTFHLRPDAVWSNGDRVRAAEFRDAWLRVLDAAAGPQYRNLLYVIDGAEAYAAASAASAGATSAGVGIEAVDEQSLRVRMARPCPYFLDLTSFPTFYPLHHDTLALLEANRASGAPVNWVRGGAFACNGAFRLAAWEFKRGLRFDRNPNYWDRGSVTLRSIDVSISADPNVQLIAYETGAADLIRTISTPVARTLRAEAAAGRRGDFHAGERFATFFFRVNCRRPPFDRADVRRALSLAVDRAAIAEKVMGCGEAPAETFVPRASLALMPRQTPDGKTVYYQPPEGIGAGMSMPERIARARELLSVSGFPMSRPIELAYASDNADYRRICEALKAMWEESLGVVVALRPIEAKVLREKIRSLDYDLARSEWFGDYLDPSTFLTMWVAESRQNRTGWASARYDELIAAADGESDNARRFALFQQAERILCEQESPIIPVFFKTGAFLLNPAFEGVFDNPRDLLPVQFVRRR